MEEGRKSLFNAGIAQTERIDGLQVTMNMARFNPLAINPIIGKYNYEVMMSAQDGLLEECWAKLTIKEKEKGDRIKRIIRDFVEYNKILTITNNGETKVNNKNYKKFLELIDLYAKNNKIFLDSHNLNSPDSDEDEGL